MKHVALYIVLHVIIFFIKTIVNCYQCCFDFMACIFLLECFGIIQKSYLASTLYSTINIDFKIEL